MYVQAKYRGIGDTPGAFSTACGGGLDALNPDCWPGIWPFSIFVSPKSQVVAPPPVPSGSRGEVVLPPPGSGGGITLPTDASQAPAVVQDILNEQLRKQQAIDASQVNSSWLDTFEGNIGGAMPEPGGINWPLWLGIGTLVAFAFVAIGGSSSRRYGR